MAIHHGGSGNPLDRDIDITRETQNITNTNIVETRDCSTAETVHFEDLEYSNPTKLTALTREIDDLHQWGQYREGQPM